MKQILIFLCPVLWFVLLGTTFVQAQEIKTDSAPPAQGSQEDLIHFGDTIDVDVVGGFEFDWRGTLTPEGFLDGLSGSEEPVYGLCRSEKAIAADIVKNYSKTLRDPQVIVRIIDRSNRALARLDGAVKVPARFRIKRTVTLRELIVLAGGLTDGASGDISIFRPKNLSCQPAIVPAVLERGAGRGDNGSQFTNIKISELLKGNAAANPVIVTGDMISVIRAKPVYVIGAVNSPKPIYIHSETTVTRAIAIAGGLARDAEGGKVSIFRQEGAESRVIEIDLAKIKSGESIDEILKPFDILDVTAKGVTKREYPPVAATDANDDRSGPELPLRIVD